MAGQYEFAARDSLFSDISETLCHKVNLCTFHFLNDRDYTANKMNCFKVQQAFANQVTDSVRRNESACAVSENIIFAVAGFDAPQMNFVS